MTYVDIVFDGPPSMPAPRFVEVEDMEGKGIKLGEWIKRDDGYWVLRVPIPTVPLETEETATHTNYNTGEPCFCDGEEEGDD